MRPGTSTSTIIYTGKGAKKRAAKIRLYGRMSKRGVRAWQPSGHKPRPVKTYFLKPDELT